MRLEKLSDAEIRELATRELGLRWVGDDDEGYWVEPDLADEALLDHFAWIDLAAPVLHPWLLEPAAQALAITPHALHAALHQEGPGWNEEGQFVTGAQQMACDDGPFVIGERLGTQVASAMMMRTLPVLPRRLRDVRPGIDRLYRLVLQAAAEVKSYHDANAPLSLLSWRAVELQAAVEALFDNGTLELVRANLDGSPLASLADLVDAARGAQELDLALLGAALRIV